MDKVPISEVDRQLLVSLQKQLDDLRKRLQIGERGEVLSRVELSRGDDDVLLVEADGFGGGLVRVIEEGNYPVDYMVREEREFSTEEEALQAGVALENEFGLSD
jgi:hypothetical protein